MKIGILSKATSETVYTYIYTRYKTFSAFPDEHFHQYEIAEGTDPRAYSFNGYQEVFDSEYVPFNQEDKYAKIYRYIKEYEYRKSDAPIEHNYVSGLSTSLYPRRTFVKGELQKVEWHSNTECSDLILKVDISYTRDPIGFAIERETIRTWVNEDETENKDKKTTKKNYTINEIDQIQEGIRRRGNIIKSLQKPILGLMIITKDQDPALTGLSDGEIVLVGRDFLKLHQSSFQSFESESHKQIQTDIVAATDQWLSNVIDGNGTTVRDYILNELNI